MKPSLAKKIIAALLLLCGLISGCNQGASTLALQYTQHCEESSSLPLIPEAQLPCDRVELPDSRGVIYSEFDGDNKGGLLLHDNITADSSVLYNALSSNDMSTNNAIWGEPECQEPEQFEAASIDLWQRYSGRWQLAVINRKAPQTIELFELSRPLGSAENNIDTPQWELKWRGCISIEADLKLKNITLTGSGIKAIQITQTESGFKKWFVLPGRANKKLTCWRWRIDQGWKIMHNNNCENMHGDKMQGNSLKSDE